MERYGYAVLDAASGPLALEVWREHHGTIDVLVTDMVMPEGIGGRELAKELLSRKPDLKVIYCSGYSNDVYGEEVSLRKGVNFLEKPFNLTALLQMIRDSRDSKA